MTPGTPPQRDDRDIGITCARLAMDRKARDVKLLFVGDRLGIADYFVIATVNNRRQARAVKDAVRLGLKERGYGVPLSASEDPEGRWSLYDYGGVVLHLLDDEGRNYFDLDSMWAGVPEIDVPDDLEDPAPGESPGESVDEVSPADTGEEAT